MDIFDTTTINIYEICENSIHQTSVQVVIIRNSWFRKKTWRYERHRDGL